MIFKMTDQWGPWIEHDGNGCPCVGLLVRAISENGRDEIGSPGQLADQPRDGFASMWLWSSVPSNWWGHRIIRYRIRKPRGMTVLREIVANPERELEGVE